uniref:Uncharacterized protein n=2 Tax=Opuntia streptacantha TaxID=393608 RepID=A0A7C8ZYE9_OPUST
MANKLLPATATLFLVILSVSISDSATLSIANADSDLVLDTDGNPLEVDSLYYMQPTNIGFRGVIGRSARPGPGIPCPLYATVYPTGIHKGGPLRFAPINNTQNQIHLSSVLTIDSGSSDNCQDLGRWTLRYDVVSGGPVVIAAGTYDFRGTRFMIEKAEGRPSYKIEVSPVPGSQEHRTYLTDVKSRIMLLLGITYDPTQALQFEFRKYKEDVVASI